MMENIGQTKEKHETNETKHKTGDLISREASTDHLKKRLLETAFNQTERYAAEMCEDIAVNRLDVWLGELPSAQPEQRWIPVTERLPEKGQKCLVSDRGRITIDVFWGRGGVYNWQFYLRDYEAWMPLPEPYKEEKKK